jgi:hypothetical protein
MHALRQSHLRSCLCAKRIYKRDDGLVINDPKVHRLPQLPGSLPYEDVIYFNVTLTSLRSAQARHLLDSGWKETRLDNCRP